MELATIWDTETTGLLNAIGTDEIIQPFITEIYAMQVDKEGTIIKEIDTLVKPLMPIPKHITKITGIDDYAVKDAPSFFEIYKQLANVFLGSKISVAHNLTFDEGIVINELKRIGKEYHFPYPPIKFCTVERSMHLKGHRLKNGELYELATGMELAGAHRAKADVQATYQSYLWLRENENEIS